MTRRELLQQSALLIGYAATAGALSNTFLACTNTSADGWKPLFLSKKQAALVAEVAETILPKTDTPGAKDLNIHVFIDKMCKDLLTEAEQEDFVAGLAQLEKDSQARFGKPFAEAPREQREAYLLDLDKAAAKTAPSVWGFSLDPNPTPVAFYRRLKNLTLVGYYTSQEIGEKVLAYDPIPGDFLGCIPLTPGMNAWNE
jgi:hypothetical protein